MSTINHTIKGAIFAPVDEQSVQNELKNYIIGQIVSNNEGVAECFEAIEDKATANLENKDENRNESKCVTAKDSIESDQEETEFDISDEIKGKNICTCLRTKSTK